MSKRRKGINIVLEHLGKVSEGATDKLDRIPWSYGAAMTVRLECTEFTSLCPVTGHPDFGTIEIEYVPILALVETKSLKLYLRKFRDVPMFNEVIAATIADDFYKQMRPKWVRVTASFNVRGGIAPTAIAMRNS